MISNHDQQPVTNSQSDSERFEALSRELLNNDFNVRLEAHGASMSPCIRDGQIVHVTPVIVSKLREGDIVLTKGRSGFRIHRLVVADPVSYTHLDVVLWSASTATTTSPWEIRAQAAAR